jgi:hypothetical protein
MAVRVGVADDSFLIREALTRLLGDVDEVELVAVCAVLLFLGQAGITR